MPEYVVYVACTECSQPHQIPDFMVELDDPNLTLKNIGEVYNDDVPARLQVRLNGYRRCPRTERLFIQKDIQQAYLAALPADSTTQ